jgi:hypothetical protein
LVRTIASPCLGHEPNVKVATFAITCDLVHENAIKENRKKKKLYEGAKKFKMGGLFKYHGLEM